VGGVLIVTGTRPAKPRLTVQDRRVGIDERQHLVRHDRDRPTLTVKPLELRTN